MPFEESDLKQDTISSANVSTKSSIHIEFASRQMGFNKIPPTSVLLPNLFNKCRLTFNTNIFGSHRGDSVVSWSGVHSFV